MTHRITPATKVAELLEHWPELEAVLVAQAPAFQKLRNPVLRRTIARVATLEQAAGIAGLSPRALVTTLRRAAGLAVDEGEPVRERAEACSGPGTPVTHSATCAAFAPGAASTAAPVGAMGAAGGPDSTGGPLIDADAMLEAGDAPLAPVFEAARALEPGAVLRVIASFRPVPLIEKLESHGYACDVGRAADGRVLLAVRRPDAGPDR
jgi:hypothetical protein